MQEKMNRKFSENFKNIPKSFVREILDSAGQEGLISFAGGLPNPELFPVAAIEASASAVLRQSGKTILQYAGSQGLFHLRKWVADRYNAKYDLGIDPADVVITNGSQQAIDLVSKMLINPGDGLVVERPTYLGAIQATAAYLPRYLTIGLTGEGPNLDELRDVCFEASPKYFYGVPNFQNPSGIRYPEQAKQELASVLKTFDLYMLEDDPYHEIVFDGNTLPPVYSYAPEHVIWTGSFSKMVAPGLRMGWAVLPRGMATSFVRAKQSTDLHCNNLTQYILLHYLENNDIDGHLREVRKAYGEQCGFMQQMIEKYLPDEVGYTRPQGGMFIWATFPGAIDSEEFVQVCMARGVVFVPGSSFFVDGGGKQHARINFSNSSFADIEKGMKVIGHEIGKHLSKVTAVVC